MSDTQALSEHAAVKPTKQVYDAYQIAYDHYNATLFGGQLPHCLITMQRKKRCFGYFSHGRFVRGDGTTTDEIALNPQTLAGFPITETLSTLVHEMVHLWQFHLGTPGRRGYHNDEWASKMEEVGLVPSSTGKPGGRRTGERMGDYPQVGGRFLEATRQLLDNQFELPWVDRYPSRLNRMAMVSATLEWHEDEDEGDEPAQHGGQGGGADVAQVRAPQAVQIVANQQAVGELQEAVDQLGPSLGSAVQSQLNNVRQHQVSAEQMQLHRPKPTRTKYRCGGDCGFQVWGRPSLVLICGKCGFPYEAVGEV